MLMFMFMMPCLILIWMRPHPKLFLPALAYTYMCYFVFGFHVHEKAIIIVVSLLALNAVESGRDAALFLRICFIGTFCLFPLLFEIRETCTNALILLTCCTIFYIILDSSTYSVHVSYEYYEEKHVTTTNTGTTQSQIKRRVHPRGVVLRWYVLVSPFEYKIDLMTNASLEHRYDAILALLSFSILIFERIGSKRMPFLPLMCYSVFGALCVLPLGYEIYCVFKRRWNLVLEAYSSPPSS